jgi:hypothetical protein
MISLQFCESTSTKNAEQGRIIFCHDALLASLIDTLSVPINKLSLFHVFFNQELL